MSYSIALSAVDCLPLPFLFLFFSFFLFYFCVCGNLWVNSVVRYSFLCLFLLYLSVIFFVSFFPIPFFIRSRISICYFVRLLHSFYLFFSSLHSFPSSCPFYRFILSSPSSSLPLTLHRLFLYIVTTQQHYPHTTHHYLIIVAPPLSLSSSHQFLDGSRSIFFLTKQLYMYGVKKVGVFIYILNTPPPLFSIIK